MIRASEFAALAAGCSDKLSAALEAADHVDVKTVEGCVDLRTFLYRMLTDRPGWIRALYALRGLLAKCLGLRHISTHLTQGPDAMDLRPGSMLTFIRTEEYDQNVFWTGGAGDKHLDALLAVIREPLAGGAARFHVATVVRYKNWLGPVYFNLVRPFHHLIVKRMARAGVRLPKKK